MMRFLTLVAFFAFSICSGDILMPDEAFKVSIKQENKQLVVDVELGKDIYLYKDKLRLELKSPQKKDLTSFVKFPTASLYHEHKIYEKSLHLVLELDRVEKELSSNTFEVSFLYQGCSKGGICYQPMSKSFTAKMQQKPSENSIASSFSSKSFVWIMASFFGFGLLLSLTPCIFPMIPILSSIIVSNGGDKMNAKKGFLLSLVYVLSMALAYAISGVIAGLFGSNLQTALQNPYVLSVFSGIFVLLSLSMFGFYELELPKSLQTRINKTSDEQKGKGVLGVAIMGFLSALIVGPCVAPPLAGALIYIGQSGDGLLGGLALFVMGLGMGVPLLLIGLSAGRFLPRPGLWMDRVKAIFGVMMLGIAIWMISRVLDESVVLLLWSLLFVFSSVYMGVFSHPKTGWAKFLQGFALIFLLYGALLFVGSFIGGGSLTSPLKGLHQGVVKSRSQFKGVVGLKELEKLIKKAKRPVMVDFGAKWCTSCKELEEITFQDVKVKALMEKFELIKIDITNNTKQDKELLEHFKLFGPPAILFFKDAKELTSLRIIGYKNPQEFLSIMQKAKDAKSN